MTRVLFVCGFACLVMSAIPPYQVVNLVLVAVGVGDLWLFAHLKRQEAKK